MPVAVLLDERARLRQFSSQGAKVLPLRSFTHSSPCSFQPPPTQLTPLVASPTMLSRQALDESGCVLGQSLRRRYLFAGGWAPEDNWWCLDDRASWTRELDVDSVLQASNRPSTSRRYPSFAGCFGRSR
ncbi:hypothetical protein FB45DRAFT_1000254 [Roridomyces roridus]|uniref:Uncharacterized protein n=1 Tax=Roridomyces roridus TaxID=1738132 RepID=A0AAD7C820_9AGAR|nr:hypothetical protein FB45DRAFT_1000254 [Roridomyces roridus]